MYHLSFPEEIQTVALFLWCESYREENLKQLIQEVCSKAIQIDFAANHPESGWLAHIRQCNFKQHDFGEIFQLTIQILDG